MARKPQSPPSTKHLSTAELLSRDTAPKTDR